MVALRRYAALGRAGVGGFTMLGWLYLLSYFKLFVTSTKYVPQARVLCHLGLHSAALSPHIRR